MSIDRSLSISAVSSLAWELCIQRGLGFVLRVVHWTGVDRLDRVDNDTPHRMIGKWAKIAYVVQGVLSHTIVPP